MFFYLSFLRPPPLQAPTYGTVPITPQIANDLRTEPFDGAQDVFYSWSLANPQAPSKQETITKPLKLTTWRQSSAYKEIPVPIPPSAREGQLWRLILSTHGQGACHTVDLGNQGIGKAALPVMSVPILFGARSSRWAGKQEQIERVYRFPVAAGSEGEMTQVSLKVTEQTSFDLDKKIWDSGIGLSSWLVGVGNIATTPLNLAELKDMLFSSHPRRILELGAGTGIVALTLGAIRSAIVSQRDDKEANQFIVTDLSSAMPLLEHNITFNSQLYPNIPPQVVVLDWDEDLPKDIQASEGFHAVVMADVTYNTASFPSLIRTLSNLIKLGSQPPVIVLGYKERDPSERTLWVLASDIGIEFEKIGERGGAGGLPVEIWLGRVKTS